MPPSGEKRLGSGIVFECVAVFTVNADDTPAHG